MPRTHLALLVNLEELHQAEREPHDDGLRRVPHGQHELVVAVEQSLHQHLLPLLPGKRILREGGAAAPAGEGGHADHRQEGSLPHVPSADDCSRLTD